MTKKNKLSMLALSILLAGGFTATSTFAARMNLSRQQLQSLIEKIVNQRTAVLNHKVNQLQHQVVVLKDRLNTSVYPHPPVSHYPGVPLPYRETIRQDHPQTPHSRGASQPTHPRYTPIAVQHPATKAKNNLLTGIYLGGTPVFTSPYIGIHSAYDGSDLVVNASSVNLDVRLLKQQQAMYDALEKAGLPGPDHPIVELSGEVAGQGIVRTTSPGNTTADIDLTTATFDIFAKINPWVSGFMSIDYDNSQLGPYRVGNSNLSLDKGFITIGNLNRSHLYGSLGQLYVPFGQYSTFMLSASLPQLLARVKARAVVLGRLSTR